MATRFMICFGDVRSNGTKLAEWRGFWQWFTTMEEWKETGYDKYDLEGCDWGWVEASDPSSANFSSAVKLLEKYGFKKSFTAWGECRFDGPDSPPPYQSPPGYDG